MKCPKCDYLGFETGDRCKNCGYHFSLFAAPTTEGPQPDVTFRVEDEPTPGTSSWLERLDHTLSLTDPVTGGASSSGIDDAFDLSLTPESDAPGAVLPDAVSPAPVVPAPVRAAVQPERRDMPRRVAARTAEPTWPDAALPLFSPSPDEDEDQPLIRLPASPRPPLAVRRTPDAPRLRAVPKPAPGAGPEPALVFPEDTVAAGVAPVPRAPTTSPGAHRPAIGGEPSSAVRRLLAVAIDYVLLLAIDAAVVYFTLRMAALGMDDWPQLPRAPLAVFLCLIALSYFCAFTAIGGQTIGKMAARIRVVTDEGGPLTAGQSVGRSLVGALSMLTLGIGFLPALFGPTRRALHDRVAGTRVVGLSA